ncbi:MAG: hypothetical protein CMN75_14605 [Spirochaeta sp.]|nr:hypothetical protein [Spirochaeta sp.]RPG03966.1 MAG: TonB-dependent receptor [Proteobacteria bacterium TMED72]
MISGLFLTVAFGTGWRQSRGIPCFLLVFLLVVVPQFVAANPTEPDSENSELLGAAQAEAVESEQESEEPLSYAGVEEVTVTARRREERLQETPVSVTAFDASALASRGVTELSELARYTPGLWFQSSAAQQNSANVFIRGVGQTEGTINADPKVGIYLDDVYQSRSLGVDLATWDVMRVEVIRGPQGALFGKNAIGGAVQILTVPPGPEYEARAQVEFGNFWARAARLTLNAPIDVLGLGDKLFARGNLIYEARDGYVFDVNLQEEFSSKNLLGGRAALRFLPTDSLDIRLAYWRSHRPVRSARGECELRAEPNDSGQDFLNSFNQVGPWPLLPVAEIVGGDFVTQCDRSFALHSSTNVPNHEVLDTTKLYGTILWDTPDLPVVGSIAAKSITAYQALAYEINLEVDSTALSLLQADVNKDRHRQFSQELQFSGWGFDERLEWTLGLYYLGEATYGQPNNVYAMVPDFEFVNSQNVYYPIEAYANVLSRTQQQTAAGYAFLDFEVVESLTASAGFRYGWEQKSLERETDLALYGWVPTPATDPPVNSNCRGTPGALRECIPWAVVDGIIQIGNGVAEYSYGQVRESWTAPTGHVNLDWRITEEINAYVGYERGFSSGGFNYLNDDGDGEPQSFKPETLSGVEIGLKTSWFENRLLANFSFYWNDYDQKQVRVQVARTNPVTGNIGFSDAILNAGDATIQGAEIELTAQPVENLLLVAGLGLQFNSYDDFRVLDEDATAALHPNGGYSCVEAYSDPQCVYTNISNKKFPFMPEYTLSLLARYTWNVYQDWDLILTGDYAWQSEVFFDIQNTEELSQSSYGLLNLRLTAVIPETETSVALWTRNVTDEEFLSAGFGLGAYVTRYYGLPRTFGITITQSFGGP